MTEKIIGNSVKLYLGDCLEAMSDIPDGSVDLVCCDPPYGKIDCSWDSIIPLDAMWKQIWRVLKKNRPVVLFGKEPFSSQLRTSSPAQFKYDWYWRKSRPSGFTNARLKPLMDIEVISVFSEGMTANGSARNMPYFPQGVGEGIDWKRPARYKGDRGVNPTRDSHLLERKTTGSNYPRQILDFANPNNGQVHPTQKPVDLMAYLVNTYSQMDDSVLDFTMGSGTTGVAAINTGRRFIGIEKDPGYFDVAVDRIESSLAANLASAAA